LFRSSAVGEVTRKWKSVGLSFLLFPFFFFLRGEAFLVSAHALGEPENKASTTSNCAEFKPMLRFYSSA